MIYLRQSTASQEVPLGPFYDNLDGDTAKTALTINNTDILIWVTGATTLATKNSGGGTHISAGIYHATLDATDTATAGSGAVFCKVSGALGTKTPICILPAAVYDMLFVNGLTDIADAILDRTAGVETNRTPRQALRLMLAALAGKLSGAATTTVAIRDTNDSKDRITATVDASGNRSAVTLDAS